MKTAGMPPGVPYIVGNEAAERFSFYGLRAILVVFMTKYLMNSAGQPDPMSDEQAKAAYHWFVAAVYFVPLLGAILSDAFLGKYRTIIAFSLLYCVGLIALTLNSTKWGLFVGLALIAAGSGGIKPCVSAHVGDQFGALNKHLLPKVFGWFYFSVNFGSSISMFLIPSLLENPAYGPRYAFGIPAVLMILATWVFWLGRRKFIHIPPGGVGFLEETFSMAGLRSVAKLAVIYTFVAVFWSLYDQTSSAWVLQAEKMDRHFFGKEWLASQFQVLNPLFVLAFIPLFSYGIYPAIDRVFKLTPLRKIGIGFFVTVVSFLLPAWVQTRIDAGFTPTIWWQALSYALVTAGEIFISITCLEFSYTQAPKKMKSLVMGLYYLSLSLGNSFTAVVNKFIQNPDKTSKLAGAQYYLFFAAVMFVTAMVFIFVAKNYREETHIQDTSEAV